MNHLPLTALLFVSLSACGTAAPVTTVDAGSDAGADVAGSAAAAACKNDCVKQKADCASVDLTQCYGLCDYVAPGLAPGACTDAQVAVWHCESVALFVCATDTNVVAQLADPATCATANAAKTAACGK